MEPLVLDTIQAWHHVKGREVRRSAKGCEGLEGYEDLEGIEGLEGFEGLEGDETLRRFEVVKDCEVLRRSSAKLWRSVKLFTVKLFDCRDG